MKIEDDTAAPATAKIVSLTAKPDALAASVEQLKRNVETLITLQVATAKIRRAAFLAYGAEGFSEDQALQLCCK